MIRRPVRAASRCGTLLMLACAAAVPATPPADGGSAAVDRVVARLGSADADERLCGAEDLAGLPASDLPLIEAAAARPGLPPRAAALLAERLPSVRQRDKLYDRAAAVRAVSQPFALRQALADYDRDGHADPKWDADAKAFLTTRFSVGLPGPGDVRALHAEAHRHLMAAVAAGCDDPDVLAYGGLLSFDMGEPPARAQALFKQAAKSASADGKVGPMAAFVIDNRVCLIALADLHRAAGDARQPLWMAAQRLVDRMIGQYLKVVALPGVPAPVATDTAAAVLARMKDLRTVNKRVPLAPFIEHVLKPLEAMFPNDPGVLRVKGEAYVAWAWEARGSGFANTVTPQGQQLMDDRLGVAAEALTAAWQADPDDAAACDQMLIVELGQAKGRPTMEQWFDRAMHANPDDDVACKQKMLYLEPKWYGSPADMLEFGHECLAGARWRTYIPLEVVDAHLTLSQLSTDPAGYWLRPGVWDDVWAAYGGMERCRGGLEPGLRNVYADLAVRCHQWAVADAQFKRLGDAADPSRYGQDGGDDLDAVRQKAAELADKPEAQGR